ncbi:MAG: hypothetical protein ACOC23_08090 [Thermodesulfobacteriota bacterium]
MNWKEALQKGLTAGKKISEKASEKGTPYLEVIRSNLNLDLVTKGELLIPEPVLERKIAESLARQESGVLLETLTCEADRIRLRLQVKKMRVRSAVSMDVFIQEIEIGPDRQTAVFRIGGEKISGMNLAGKIVVAILHVVIRDILKTAVSRAKVDDLVRFSKDERTVTANLAGLEPVQKLRSPIFQSDKSVLDLVSFRIFHQSGGLTVKTDFSETGTHLKQGVVRFASKAGKAVARWKKKTDE